MYEKDTRREELSKKIIKRRTKHKLSMRRLAIKSGVSIGTIHNIENGACSPRIETLDKIARVLQLQASRLLKEVGY